jgi:RNA polymerase sigma factor (sigma-70 family)
MSFTSLMSTIRGALPGLQVPNLRAHSCFEATSPTAKTSIFENAILPDLDAAYNLARWLTDDPVDAENVVHDACLRAVQNWGATRRHSGRIWLLQIVLNIAYSKLRTKKTGVEVARDKASQNNGDGGVSADVAAPDPGPKAAFAIAQGPTQLTAAVAALPIDLRACLILREMEDLSYKEIARITDVSIDTVVSRLFRARRLLMTSTADALHIDRKSTPTTLPDNRSL